MAICVVLPTLVIRSFPMILRPGAHNATVARMKPATDWTDAVTNVVYYDGLKDGR
jgi:hypothetical protein